MNKYAISIKNQSGDNALPDYEEIILAKNKEDASQKFWAKLPEMYDQANDEVYSAKDDWSPEDLLPFIHALVWGEVKKPNDEVKKPIKVKAKQKSKKHMSFEKRKEAIKMIAIHWNSKTMEELVEMTGYNKKLVGNVASRLRKKGFDLPKHCHKIRRKRGNAFKVAVSELKEELGLKKNKKQKSKVKIAPKSWWFANKFGK